MLNVDAGGDRTLLAVELAGRREGAGVSLPAAAGCRYFYTVLRSARSQSRSPAAQSHCVVPESAAPALPPTVAADAAGARTVRFARLRSGDQQRIGARERRAHVLLRAAHLLLSHAHALHLGALSRLCQGVAPGMAARFVRAGEQLSAALGFRLRRARG